MLCPRNPSFRTTKRVVQLLWPRAPDAMFAVFLLFVLFANWEARESYNPATSSARAGGAAAGDHQGSLPTSASGSTSQHLVPGWKISLGNNTYFCVKPGILVASDRLHVQRGILRSRVLML